MKINNVSDTSAKNRFRPYHIAVLALLILGTIFIAQREHGKQNDVPFQYEEGSVFSADIQFGHLLHEHCHGG